jgi:hypothetical protein
MRYALVCIALFATTAAADVSRSVAASVRRGNVRRVIVAIPAGEINVRNGSSDRISVAGEVQRSDDDADARRDIKSANVEIVSDGDDAIIRKTGASDWGWRVHTSYHLDVNVPRGTSVELETKYGEVTIEGEFGNIDVDLRAGEIHLRTPRAAVRELDASARIGEVHTDFGDDREDHEGILPGTTHFVNANGRSRVSLHTTVGELHVTLTR